MNFITVLKWLRENDIDIYSTQNEGKSVLAERFIRTLKNKIYKHMTAVLNTVLILVKKNLNLKLVIMLQFQGIKTFLLEDMLQFCPKQFLLLAKLQSTVPWTWVINDLNGEQIIGTFYEKELQKINQKEFRMEKTIKRKGNKLYVKKFIGHKNLKTSIFRIQLISALNSLILYLQAKLWFILIVCFLLMILKNMII